MGIATLESFEKLVASGCSGPGCDHKKHDLVYLHGACHMYARTKVSYPRDWVFKVTCAQCDKLIVDVAMTERHGPAIENKCHEDSGVDVSFRAGTKVLQLSCSACSSHIATISIKSQRSS